MDEIQYIPVFSGLTLDWNASKATAVWINSGSILCWTPGVGVSTSCVRTGALWPGQTDSALNCSSWCGLVWFDAGLQTTTAAVSVVASQCAMLWLAIAQGWGGHPSVIASSGSGHPAPIPHSGKIDRAVHPCAPDACDRPPTPLPGSSVLAPGVAGQPSSHPHVLRASGVAGQASPQPPGWQAWRSRTRGCAEHQASIALLAG